MSNLSGQCSICGWKGEFLHREMEREGMHCGNCSSSSRHRAVIYVLGKTIGSGGLPLYQWKERRSLSILESSARGAYPMMLGDKFNYLATEFDEAKIASGELPREYADFQNLHFNDASFDLVIASDVFEHIRKDEEGFREVYRVLKPGGSLIMTVPYDHSMETTRARVDTSSPTDRHLMEPEYHGGGGHTLTYRNYGRDLLSLLNKTGFSVCRYEVVVPESGITRQNVFVGRKALYTEVLDAGPAIGRPSSIGPLLPYRLFLLLKYNLSGLLKFLKEFRRR